MRGHNLSSRAQVTVVNQKERHSELAEESRRSHPRRPLARARFPGKLGMTFFFIRLLVRGHLEKDNGVSPASNKERPAALAAAVLPLCQPK